MTRPRPGVEVALRVPEGWWDLPLRAATLREDIAAVVDARLAGTRPDVARRDELVAVLETSARAALATGAVFASQIAAVSGTDSFAASLLVVLRRIPDLDPTAIEAAALALGGPDIVERVRLDRLGTVVRRRSRRRVGRDAATGLGAVVMEYFLPVAGTDWMVIVTGCSPNVDATEVLAGLFDSIVSTLEVAIVPAEATPTP